MKFRKHDQAQRKFITLDYRSMLGEDSDAVKINDIVESLDFSKFESRFGEEGAPAYHPKMMMKIISYGYLKSMFGGRPLHTNYESDLGLRFLSNDDFPDFRTINLFRVNFADEIADVFAQIVMLCDHLGLIGFENLAIDGQKLKANANVFQNKNLKGVQKEKEKLVKLLKKLLGEEISPQKHEVDLKKKREKIGRRLKKLDEALEILKQAGGEDDKTIRLNLTDPDSRVMTDKRKVKNPAYNAQNGVDDKCQVITAVKIIATGSDNDELFPMAELSKKNTGTAHKNTLADCGYSNKEIYNMIEVNEDSEYYVPDRTMYSSKKNKYSKWHFIYDTNKDVYLCPEGRELKYVRTSKDSKGHLYKLYHGANCSGCKARKKCLRQHKKKARIPKDRCRSISIFPEDELIKKMRDKLNSKDGKEMYRKRMGTVEPVHGDMQKNRCFLQFSVRGEEKVSTEYFLLAVAHNMRKIILHGADAFKKFRATI